MKKTFAKIGGAVAAAFTTQKIAEFGKMCITAASDVQEMENKFNVVFDGMTEDVDAWAESYASAIGRNKNAIKEFLADNQNMFVGMGMTRQEGAKLSEQMVQLAFDLASFNNLDETQAVNALSKALMGETEAAKTLGAVLNDNTIAMAMNTMGIDGNFNSLSESMKMQVRYTAVLMQSTDAVGDCERSVDSFKGQQIKLQSQIEAIIETIGGKLLPIATEVISKTADVASFVLSHIDDIILAVEILSGVLVGTLAAKAITSVIGAFTAANAALTALIVKNGEAAIAQGVLSGSIGVAEIVVGVLTGKITIATAVQHAWNAAMKANPIGIIITLLGALVLAVKRANDAYKQHINDLVGVAQSEEEASAKVAELKEKISDLETTAKESGWTDEATQQLADYRNALKVAEEQLASFQTQQQEAEESAKEPAQIFKNATDEYVAGATEIMNKFQETYDGVYSKVTSYFEPFEKVKISVKTSVKDIIEAMQSQIDFNNEYTENLNYLKESGLGDMADYFQQYGAEGAAYAKEIADAIKKAGGVTTEEGQKIAESLVTAYTGVEQTQFDLANTLTLANGEIENAMQDLNDDYAGKISGLNMSEEAMQNAKQTMDGILQGINNGKPGVLSAMEQLGTELRSRLKTALDNFTFNFTGNLTVKGNVPGSYKTGLDYVPFDEYPAILHKGEAVLTAEEAAAWRAGKETGSEKAESGSGSGGVVINQYIQSVAQTPAELAAATEAYFVNARWAMA